VNSWVTILMVVCGLLLVLAIGAGVGFYRNPLAVNSYFERRALKRAGSLRARVIPVSTGNLTLWDGGDGPAVLLLHGAGDQAGTWSKVVPHLVGKYRLLIPDMPGHGESEPQNGPLDIEMMFTAMNEMLAVVSPDEPVIIVGNSLGAWVALLMAARQPEKVRRVVLVNGGAIRGDYKGPSLIPENVADARRLMVVLMGPEGEIVPNFVLKDVVREAHRGPLVRLMTNPSAMGASLLDGKLNEVEVPVDLLWGKLDQMFNLSYANRMMSELPTARITILKNCGHVPQRQCPVHFTQALMKILDEAPEKQGK
jgi:pimeloyl-ACP methyl ester carboxylesterase